MPFVSSIKPIRHADQPHSPVDQELPCLYQFPFIGAILAEAEQASLAFDRSYQLWKANEQHQKFFLEGKELRQALRHRKHLPWGTDKTDRELFLKKSCDKRSRRYTVGLALGVAIIAAIIAAIYLGMQEYLKREMQGHLKEWQLPEHLYTYGNQLDVLSIMNQSLTNLRWLPKNLNELKIHAPRLNNWRTWKLYRASRS